MSAHPFIPLLAFAAPLLVSASPPDDLDGVHYAQLVYRERVVVRIPRLPTPSRRQAEPMRWDEKKAPKCVPVDRIASASIAANGDVDLIVTDGRRLRARLDDDCPTLNFYNGFYLKRASDGMVCAGRDSLRSRSGARCEIDKFRTLVAKK